MPDSEHSPGATPFDVSGLLLNHNITRRDLYAAELKNILIPTVKYLARRPGKRRAPFTLPWVYSLHREMFGKVWSWAGQIRRTEKTVGVAAFQIELCLAELLKDLEFWREFKTYPIIEQAARLHHRAVQIHPFENGNGRWSRMLANIWLKREGLSPTHWPETTIGEESIIRREYLDAVRAGDSGDLSLIIALHARYTPG